MSSQGESWVGLTVAGGRFHVEALLDEGEAATDYRAFDSNLNAKVVVKVLRRGLFGDEEAALRFARKIRFLTTLSHPALVPITDVGVHDGLVFVVMPYLPGGSLKQNLAAHEGGHSLAVDRQTLNGWLTAVAAALDFLHNQGCLHLDVRPENVLFDISGHAQLGGAGVIGLLASFQEPGRILATTGSGIVLGTPEYLAPELILKRHVDGRADQYALAVSVYEVLCGRPPFEGARTTLMGLHTTCLPLALTALQPWISERLSQAVLKGLAKDPGERYRTCAEFAAAVVAELGPSSGDVPRGSEPGPDPAVPARRPGTGRSGAPGAFLSPEESPLAPSNPPPERSEEHDLGPQEVQFTVYRPRRVQPGVWYPMLVFTHLAERRPDAPEAQPDPIEQVRAEARQLLGSRTDRFRESSVDARQAIPREGEITLLPDVPGVEFNPDRRVFRWWEDIHREDFRLRASAQLDGQVARGRLSAYFGAILLAEVDLAIQVDDAHLPPPDADRPEHATARPYRKIFASYSHEDMEIVRQYERYVETLGDRYLRDVRDLRAGQEWDRALMRLIEEADVFQLFWSTHSMLSTFVCREWEYALSLRRPYFIRPTYWEEPLPESPDGSLPPDVLRRLHFHRIALVPATAWEDPPGLSSRPSPRGADPTLRSASAYVEPPAALEDAIIKDMRMSRGAKPRSMRPVRVVAVVALLLVLSLLVYLLAHR